MLEKVKSISLILMGENRSKILRPMLYFELERADNFDPHHPTEHMINESTGTFSAFEARTRALVAAILL
jgi:hypothetical protein